MKAEEEVNRLKIKDNFENHLVKVREEIRKESENMAQNNELA